MKYEDTIKNEYFEWLCNLVCSSKTPESISYRRLLMELHSIEFTYSIPMDENRADDGIQLRYRYALQIGYESCLDCLEGPCSVLEMMIALAIRCEEDIMDDPRYGNRTSQWFWQMIVNLGIGHMTDNRFNRALVRDNIDIFLNREYQPNDTGGLFVIKNYKGDLRTVEIWYQLCLYLDTVV